MAEGGGLPGGDGGRSLLPRGDGGGAGFVPRAGCHKCLRWRGPEDAKDRRLSASAVPKRGCGSLSTLPGGARAGPLGPLWWGSGPSAAPLVDCRAPFVRRAMCQWHQASEGLATRSSPLPAEPKVQLRAEAFYLEPLRKRFQSVDIVRTFSYMSGLDEEWKSSAVVHNLKSVQKVVKPHVNAAPKMSIAACAAVIGTMILFLTLLVLAIRRLRNRLSVEQENSVLS